MIRLPLSNLARGRGGRLLLAAVVAVACARFVLAVQSDAGGNRGDFFHTMPGPIVETINKTLWVRPEFTDTEYPKHAYTYGPTQYFTIFPFLFAESYDDLAAALLWLYVPLTCWAAVLLWKMARILAPAADKTASLMAVVAAMGLFFPLLHAFAGREFEVVCFALMSAAAYLLVTGRATAAAGIVAYVAWFKIWPLAFVVHYAARRRYESLAAFCAVSAALILLVDFMFGLEYFSIFSFIRNIGPLYLSGLSQGTAFCSERNGVSLAAGFCAIEAQFAGFPSRLALITLLTGTVIATGLTFVALERAKRSEHDRRWREFLEFSLILTVVLTFIRTEYYYFTFLFIPIVGLGARYFAPGSDAGTPRRALLILTYCALTALVVPVSILSRMIGADFWSLYTTRGLYLAGELGLLSLLVAEYLRVAWSARPRAAQRAEEPVADDWALAARRVGWQRPVVCLVGLVVGVAILATRTWGGTTVDHVQPLGRRAAFTLGPPPGWEFVSTHVPVVSPDGSSVAMIVRRSDRPSTLWIQPTRGGEGKAVPHTAGAEQPFWAPDGSAIAFFANGSLSVASLAGGTVRTAAAAPNPRGGTWSRGGTLIFAPSEPGPLVMVPAEGGDSRTVTKLEGDLSHRWPRFLDDGVHFVYAGVDDDNNEWSYLGSLALDERIRLGVLGTHGKGELVAARAGVLFGTPFDSKTMIVEGWAARLSGFLPRTSEIGRSYAVSDGGVISFWNTLKLAKVRRDGTTLAEYELHEVLRHPRISPDGKHVAVAGNSVIYLLAADTLRPVRVITGRGPVSAAVWSPDSRSLAFSVDEGPRAYINVVNLDTQEEFRLLDRPAGTLAPSDWTRDGHFVLETIDRNTGAVYVARAAVRPDAVLETMASGRTPRLSGDGKWLAFVSFDTGSYTVHVTQYPRAERSIVPPFFGEAPIWNGRELIYKEGRKIVRGIPDMTESGQIELTSREVLFEGSYQPQYDVGDGGKTFIAIALADYPNRVQILARTPPVSREGDATLPILRAR